MTNALSFLNSSARYLINVVHFVETFAVAISIILGVAQVMKLHRSFKYTVNTFRLHGWSRAFKIGFAYNMVCFPSLVFFTVLVLMFMQLTLLTCLAKGLNINFSCVNRDHSYTAIS